MKRIALVAIPSYNRVRLANCITKFGYEPVIVHPKKLKTLFDEGSTIDGIIHIMSTEALDELEVLRTQAKHIPFLNSVEAVLTSANKFISGKLWAKNNIPIPQTLLAKNDEELKNLAYSCGYPVILKQPDGSEGKQVALALSPQTLIETATSIRQKGKTLIVQEFISESRGRDVRIIVVGNKIIASMERIAQRKDEFRANIHQGAIGQPVKLTEDEERIALKAIQVIGLDLSGIDIIRSKRGPLVLESNSFPGLEGIEKYTGSDVATEIVREMINKIRSLSSSSSPGL